MGVILLFMVDKTWWYTVNTKVKKQVLRIANGKSMSAGPVKFGPIPDSSEESKQELRRQNGVYRNHRKRVETAVQLRSGTVTFSDVRTCRNTRCRELFLVPKGHPHKESCSIECGRNFRQLKFKKAARERKLESVRAAMKRFRSRSDWKERVARAAGVTKNFISYAIRRGEVGREGRRLATVESQSTATSKEVLVR